MLALQDNLRQSVDSIKAHKLRAALTTLGLTMGVTTLITVVTIVQGANLYVEQKIATLGNDVFQVARTPFNVTDFDLIIKSLRYRRIHVDDYRAIAEACDGCDAVGASASTTVRARLGDVELTDVNMIGQTPNMIDIDTRTLEEGRFFSETESRRALNVCVIGQTLNERLFPEANAVGRTIRLANQEFTVLGVYEKFGSVLGQDADNFAIVPLETFLRLRGSTFSLTLNIKATGGEARLENAQDQVRSLLRARRHLAPGADEDFFFGTRDNTIALWQSISSAFFAVFLMVSSISAVVGGIVIMNVMLVSVTERTKEIGVRRALGATQSDIRNQFLSESVMQCLVGGLVGIAIGFGLAVLLRQFTAFPASVQLPVALLGMILSSSIGLFFGIYPAVRASRLDPVVALRAE